MYILRISYNSTLRELNSWIPTLFHRECVMGLRLLVFNSFTYQWHYFSYCNNVYMNIIKSDSRCHLYRTCSPFPSLKPCHLVADAFRVGNKEHYQASEQPNKLANLLTSKTAGQKALIAGYMRLYSLDEMIWLKSKAIKNSTTIRWLKIEIIDLLYTFFTIFVNSLSVFFFLFPTKKE